MAEKARTSYLSEGIDWPREDAYVSSSRRHMHPRELFQSSVFPFSSLSSQSSASKEISGSGLNNDNSDCDMNSSQGSINSNVLTFPPPHPSKFEPSIIKSTHSSQGEYNPALQLPPLSKNASVKSEFESPPAVQIKPAYIWDPETLPPLYPPPSEELNIISPPIVSPTSTLPSAPPSSQKEEVITKFNINNDEYEAALALQSLMRHYNSGSVKEEPVESQLALSQLSVQDEYISIDSSQNNTESQQDYKNILSRTPSPPYTSSHVVDIIPVKSSPSSPIDIDPINDEDFNSQTLVESQEISSQTPGKKKVNNNYKRAKSKAASAAANEEDSFQWQALNIPDSLWEEALNTYDRVKTHKSLLSRQTSRRHNAALASIVIILCRKRGLPRTFTEICTMTGVSKREIGTFYKLMLSILEVDGTEVQRLCPEQFMKRWCQALVIPEAITNTAIRVLQEADALGISTGKCPNSSCAASIWLTVRYYNAYIENFIQSRSHLFESGKHYVEPVLCELKDVAEVTGVAMATVNNSFRNLLPHRFKLLPLESLDELMSSQVRTRLPLIEPSINNNDKHNRSSSPLIVDSL